VWLYLYFGDGRHGYSNCPLYLLRSLSVQIRNIYNFINYLLKVLLHKHIEIKKIIVLEMYYSSWKVILARLRKPATVSTTNKTIWKSNDTYMFTWEGISYIIKCFISNTHLVTLVLANSSESSYCLPDTCSHSETPNTLDSSASLMIMQTMEYKIICITLWSNG
jgi:hypothetical protein